MFVSQPSMRTLGAIALELTVLRPRVNAALRRENESAARRMINSPVMAIELHAGKTDRDILVEIVTTLNRLTEDLEDARENLEPRIRSLENFRWWILGACASLSFMGGMIGHVLWH
jgi:hypothetical protein